MGEAILIGSQRREGYGGQSRMMRSYASTAFPDSGDSSGGPRMTPNVWGPMEQVAGPCASLTAARGALLMLTMLVIGIAMVVGSVALVVGLCILPTPPSAGGRPAPSPPREKIF